MLPLVAEPAGRARSTPATPPAVKQTSGAKPAVLESSRRSRDDSKHLRSRFDGAARPGPLGSECSPSPLDCNYG